MQDDRANIIRFSLHFHLLHTPDHANWSSSPAAAIVPLHSKIVLHNSTSVGTLLMWLKMEDWECGLMGQASLDGTDWG